MLLVSNTLTLTYSEEKMICLASICESKFNKKDKIGSYFFEVPLKRIL